MKRFFALFLAVVMCAAMAVPAFASSTDPAPTSNVVIYNADHGKNYIAIRVFDADVAYAADGSEASVSYTVKHDETATSMYSILKAGTNYVNGETTIECPFQLDLTHDHGVGADVPVSHKTPREGQEAEFGRGWMYQMYKSGAWVPTAGTVTTKTLADTELNALTFENMPYGYYIVFVEGSDIATAVTVKAPTTTIYDKNTRTPGDPEKKIRTSDGLASDVEAEVGDLISYTASFQATNYRTVAGDSGSSIITEYNISDMATGVKYASMDSVKIYKTKTAAGTFTDCIDTLVDENMEMKDWKVKYTATKDAKGNITGYHATVAWADPIKDGDGNITGYTSKYPSPVYVVIEYKMYITEAALTLANGNTATNTFSPSYVVNGNEVNIPNPPSTRVHTTGLSIKKVDERNSNLDGAKFILAKVTEEVDPEDETKTIETESFYYKKAEHSDGLKGDGTKEDWVNVEWGTREQALEVTAENQAMIQTFGGLKSGKYHLYETEAPVGYYAPQTPWDLEIEYDDESATFSAKISSDGGKTWTDLDYSKDSTATYAFFTTSIVNTGTKNLPNTGAAGTTMLLVSGTVLFMGTMLLLVTKKRLYNENF